jgi:hypothetical protein
VSRNMSELCIRCGLEEASFVRAVTLCLLYYWKRNGLERPFDLIQRAHRPCARMPAGVASAVAPSSTRIYDAEACYIYRRRNGKERPYRYMWADDMVCKNCKFEPPGAIPVGLRWCKTHGGLCD